MQSVSDTEASLPVLSTGDKVIQSVAASKPHGLCAKSMQSLCKPDSAQLGTSSREHGIRTKQLRYGSMMFNVGMSENVGLIFPMK